ncbi:pyruvate dehydrogenase [acetyl-transferring]-phosphatase 1, mitochondrial [Bactrocera oleae]|uniref:pyruvate dehydrogenase [acetyl-transferring]-phosphatase 1, mitochondrial n=1 Tax=Bactrocera oleae TaxID=104688 RepID=UPI0006B857BB|nr:pyruvate dehydrogenase [acetyl-transferring]-phosphatase 1, mitochondrial [Bactrocera oleae]XP_014102484.1 pyruvate dehydrogenase [acetyl-transferring]-phosphatase 1, mitochondrial [Bactrocera oleae]XP_014102485.1 pyruvate dehydrogenase [acetyl-transferring]-phosphatase 1, mitochondrial [Bactrocera oleae]XP_014102486.1 pyruvate dehydrogenase [acetyl-transferring]-phosphatase 1, mitochondrial [Bactrocera oleae]XP_036221391.1 pyruvate dehydrogenase [acetyl-transferring]-phosphatase 1, mitochon
MLTLLLRNSVVCIRQGNCSNVGGAIRHFRITIRQEAQLPNLSPYDINLILRENEYIQTFAEDDSIVRSYESNQLSSNRPCEDSRTEATFLHKNGFICGVFDGHGGPACSQVISKRLLRYVAAGTIDRGTLNEVITKDYNSQSFLRCHNDKADFVSEIKNIYENSFREYVQTISGQAAQNVAFEISNAFMRLDDDLSREALKYTNMRTMSVAMSGAVACVAHIDHLNLHVASTGDCGAVLGIQCPETGQWQSKKLNNEHNADNLKEVQRILEEHPKGEHDTAIRNERLLGQLAPLRALGDFRYKWSNEIMNKYVLPTFGEHAVPEHYYTPPYLTALPEVQQHVLGPSDKFLVIASDGLWDFLTPSQVVGLVGEHLNSKKVLEPMRLPPGEVTLLDVSKLLAERKAGRARKPLDQNSATHLIRNALGGTDYGIEHSKIAYYLSLPQDVVRLYRDDITITVVYFNTEYITKLNENT